MTEATPTPDEDAYAERSRSLIAALGEDRFDPDQFVFGEGMDDPTELANAWAELTGIFGEFRGIEGVAWRPDAREAHVRFSLGSTAFRAEVAFDDDGGIVAVPIEKCDDGGGLSTLADLGRVARHALSKRLSRSTDVSGTAEPGPERAAAIVRQFFRGEYEAVCGEMGPELRAELPPDRLAALWENSLSGRLGEFEGIDDVTYDEAAREATVYLASTGESAKVEVQFDDDGAVTGFLVTQAHGEGEEYAPPAYVDGDEITERELAVPADAGELGGALTLPAGDGPHPGVVLVHGSGPNDRDASNGPNRPFQDLAWGLASEGVATLRYDKRSYATGWEIESGTTPDAETVRDAVTAVETLGAVDQVAETVVLGHSLGGSLAPRIAERVDVAGVVCLAGTPRHPAAIIVDQTEFLATVDGPYTADDREEFAEVTAAAERVRAGDFEDGEWLLDHPASYWRYWNEYDPGTTLRSASVPTRIVHFGRDVQVTVADLARWKRQVGDCSHVDVERYPHLNHLGIPTAGKRTPAEYGEHGDVAAELVTDLAGWVRRRGDV